MLPGKLEGKLDRILTAHLAHLEVLDRGDLPEPVECLEEGLVVAGETVAGDGGAGLDLDGLGPQRALFGKRAGDLLDHSEGGDGSVKPGAVGSDALLDLLEGLDAGLNGAPLGLE